MKGLHRIRFWHLMVGWGFVLVVIGLVMIFLPPGVGDSDSFIIEFFNARFEGSEMGLALIVLGLSCFLLGHKDLEDLRVYQSVQQDMLKTGRLTAKLVANRVEKSLNGLSAGQTRLRQAPEFDLVKTRQAMWKIQNGRDEDLELSDTIQEAERGLALLTILDGEDY